MQYSREFLEYVHPGNNENALRTIDWATDKERQKRYWSPVTAAWAFYTPLMGAPEFAITAVDQLSKGKSLEESLLTAAAATGTSRVISAGIHAAVFRPMRIYREWLAKKRNVTPESPESEKRKVAIISLVTTQAPAYGTILGLTKLATESLTIEDAAVKFFVVLGLGYLTARAYNKFADIWGERHFGIPSLLYNQDLATNIYVAAFSNKGTQVKAA